MNNCTNLYKCFCYNQKSELFTGDNQNYCNIWKQLNNSIYTNKIFVGGNILVLILNRGKGNIFDLIYIFQKLLMLFNLFWEKNQTSNNL